MIELLQTNTENTDRKKEKKTLNNETKQSFRAKQAQTVSLN